jgi:hypothetical protein
MIDGLHTNIQNRTMKPLAIDLSKVGWGQEGEGNLINVQCKAIQNCHNEYPLINEYILIKKIKRFLKFHFTPFRMVVIKNTNNNKCW